MRQYYIDITVISFHATLHCDCVYNILSVYFLLKPHAASPISLPSLIVMVLPMARQLFAGLNGLSVVDDF